jgi:hypothetical protein
VDPHNGVAWAGARRLGQVVLREAAGLFEDDRLHGSVVSDEY